MSEKPSTDDEVNAGAFQNVTDAEEASQQQQPLRRSHSLPSATPPVEQLRFPCKVYYHPGSSVVKSRSEREDSQSIRQQRSRSMGHRHQLPPNEPAAARRSMSATPSSHGGGESSKSSHGGGESSKKKETPDDSSWNKPGPSGLQQKQNESSDALERLKRCIKQNAPKQLVCCVCSAPLHYERSETTAVLYLPCCGRLAHRTCIIKWIRGNE
jgi:hypothetical protein